MTKVNIPLRILPILAALFMLPQYGYLVYKHGDFYFPKYIEQVREHSDKIDSEIFVGTDPQWFAFNHKLERAKMFHYELHHNTKEYIADKKFVWIDDEQRSEFVLDWINWDLFAERFKQEFAHCPTELLSSFDYGGHKVNFQSYDCRPNS